MPLSDRPEPPFAVINRTEFQMLQNLIAQASQLPTASNIVWDFLVIPAAETKNKEFVFIVIDRTKGTALSVHRFPTVQTFFSAVQLVNTMLQVPVNAPASYQPHRPATILIDNQKIVQQLKNFLSPLNIDIVFDDSPEKELLYEHFKKFVQAKPQQQSVQPMAFSDQYDDQVLERIHYALIEFYKIKPWLVFNSNKPVQVIWADDKGKEHSFCVSLMGDLGEQFGLALFDHSLEWAITYLNRDPYDALCLLGSMESLNLLPEDELAKKDITRYKKLKLKPLAIPNKPRWAGLQRISFKGYLPSKFPLAVLAIVLEIIVDRVKSKPNQKVSSLKKTKENVAIQYPLKPSDDFSNDQKQKAVKMSFELNRFTQEKTKKTHIVIVAPIGMSLKDIWYSFPRNERCTYLPPNISILAHDPDNVPVEVLLWRDHPSSPQLCVGHLLAYAKDLFNATVETIPEHQITEMKWYLISEQEAKLN